MSPGWRADRPVPLRSDAGKAFDAVDDILGAFGADGRFSDEDLARLLGYAGVKNGAFRARLNALRRYRLVDGGASSMALSPLGRRVAAGDRADSGRARAAAVLNDPFVAQVVERYSGQPLPDDDALAEHLRDDLGVADNRVRSVALQTAETLRSARLLRPDRTVVAPESLDKELPVAAPSQLPAGDDELRAVIESAVAALPSPDEGWTPEELDRWVYVLRARLLGVYRLPVRLPFDDGGAPH